MIVSDADWAALARRRILFLHQSVGADLVSGIRSLVAGPPMRDWPVRELGPSDRVDGPGLHHLRAGRNGAPLTKLEAFTSLVAAHGARLDLVAMKFCYVDVDERTDVDRLLASYVATVNAVHRFAPAVRVLHLTMPLQTDWGTYFHWKRVLRGRLTTHRELNAVREEYNAGLRAAAADRREALFDLAACEAEGPDGRRSTVRWRGRRVPVLARAWTVDGGHLVPAAQYRIGAAFLVACARVPLAAGA